MKLQDFVTPWPAGRRKTVVVPLANTRDSIRCVATAMEKQIADFILLGEADKIHAVAAQAGVDISGAEIIPATDEQAACDLAARLVHEGRAQALMKGLVQSATFIGAILHKEHGLIAPGRLISCVSVFEIPTYHKLLAITDPAVNIAPTLAGKVRILQNAVALAHQMGLAVPKVACVAAVEKVTPKMPGTAEAQQLKNMDQQGVFGAAQVDGPLGFDVAISKEAAAIKGVDSAVAGDSDIILLPEIVAANVLYKSLVWFSRATVASVVVGAKVPIILSSRSDSEENKLLSVALAVHVTAPDMPPIRT